MLCRRTMKFLKIVLFQYAICSCSSTLLIDKAAFYANSVFKEFISSIVWWHSSHDVTEFIKQYHGCIVLSRLQDGDNKFIHYFSKKYSVYTQTIFFASDVDEVQYFMALLNQDLIRAIRLIVVLLRPSTHDKLSKLMKIAWENDIADILVLSSDAEDVSLTTYFPYGKGQCGDCTPVYLDYNTTDIFPKKFTNFYGCEIRAILFNLIPYSRFIYENGTVTSISGIDGDIFTILLELLNATMTVVSATERPVIGAIINRTATGLLGDLLNKKADIFCPSLIMTHSRYPYFQFTHVYETCNIHWFGPKRHKISEWLRILQPFMTIITPIIIASSIVFAVVIMSAGRFGLHKSIRQSSALFQTFVIFLGQEVKFVTSSRLINSLFMLWIWFCMVVRIAYQGVLVNGLQKTSLENPLGNFETAVKKINNYGGLESFREYFAGTRYYNDYNVVRLHSLLEYLKDIEAGKKFLLVTDIVTALHNAPEAQLLSHDPVSQPPLAFFMRPRWPAVDDISNLLLRMIEAGFIQNTFRNYSWEWVRYTVSDDMHEAKPLCMETLIGCFYGLAFMYIICIIVFLMEIMYHKVLHKYNLFTRNLPYIN